MEIKQWVNNIHSGLFEGRKAYRIGFQALPGTKFTITGTNNDTPSEIIMGPTGIYEIGFATPLIEDFNVTEPIDSPHSIMILDAILASDTDENLNEYDAAFIAYNYNTQENVQTKIPDPTEEINRWEVGGAEV